jgi:hypothetical protein
MPDLAPLPSFIIIGAQRSATRWLRANLSQHPDVYIPPFEMNYFNDPERMAALGTRGYRGKFETWAGEPIIGESSPNYLLWGATNTHDTAEAIRRTFKGNVKLIALCRNPIDRAYSAIVEHIKRGRLPKDATLPNLLVDHLDVVDELGILKAGQYTMCLFPYLQFFDRENLLIEVVDDIADKPEEVYARVLDHIGAAPGFTPTQLHQVLFSNKRSVKAIPLTAKERYGTYAGFYSATIPKFESLIERDLPAWYPPKPEEA